MEESFAVKGIQFRLQFLLVLYSIVFLICFFILFPFLIGKIICISLALLTLLATICVPWFSKNYEVFSHNGIKRIKKGEILFEISWDDVESISYWGMRGAVVLAPYVLWINLKQDAKNSLPRSGNNIISDMIMVVHMRKKDFLHIDKIFIPKEIRRF